MDLQKMSIEKKIARLSEKKKAYILGYIDRALSGKSMRKMVRIGHYSIYTGDFPISNMTKVR